MEKKPNSGTDVLKKVRGYYEGAVQSSAYQQWREEAQRAWAFYDGEQWTKDEIARLSENGQPAIVINKIASKVDNIAGSEIAGRTRILYRSRSGERGEEATARSLSDLALYVAERSDQAIEVSNLFKAGLVTGIGWLDVGVEKGAEGPLIFNRVENEMDVVWDPRSRRVDYSDARFVCRERWLGAYDIRQLFPKTHEKLMAYLADRSFTHGFGQQKTLPYINQSEQLFRVVEVQYKVTEKQYTVKAATGEEFITFDKKAADASKNADVTSCFVPRVYVAYFSADTLLDNQPLAYQHGTFTLVPYIYKRQRENGQPYGMVRMAIDPQRELNKRRSKAMHLLNTAQVIADVDAVEDPNILAREAARPDGVILKRAGKDLRILRNTDLAASQVAVMDQASKDIQEVMGVFDESLGKQSNATSGLAIQTRQLAGNMNQMFAFDALRRSKKQLGVMVLSLVRQFFTHEMVIRITDKLDAPQVVKLNAPVVDEFGQKLLDENGAPVLQNDVRTGVFDVHVEEVKDVTSSREMDAAQLNMLLQAGVQIPPSVLVEATSISNKEQILAHLNGAQNLTNNEGNTQ